MGASRRVRSLVLLHICNDVPTIYVVVTVQLLDGRGARVGNDVTNHFDRQLDGALGAREPERPRLNHRGHGNLVLPTVLIQKGMRLVCLSLGKEVCSPVGSIHMLWWGEWSCPGGVGVL